MRVHCVRARSDKQGCDLGHLGLRQRGGGDGFWWREVWGEE